MALKTRKAIQVQNLLLQDLHQIFLELEIPVRPFVSNNETKEDLDGQTYIVIKKDDFEDYLVLILKEYDPVEFKCVPIVSVGVHHIDLVRDIYNAEDYYDWKHGVLKETIKNVLWRYGETTIESK